MSLPSCEFSRKYLSILNTQYRGLNLTRITEPELFHIEQFADSVAPLQRPQFKRTLREKNLLLDVGFGGGFPLLPLAYCCPWMPCVGFEGKLKKWHAVQGIARELGLTNVTLFPHRIETSQ